MKSRAYRRYMEEVKVIKRLRYRTYEFVYFYDANESYIKHGRWYDMISSKIAFESKTITTNKYDTRDKTKWGSKGKKKKYIDSSDNWTRIKDKNRFKKYLESEGFKHLPTYTECRSELESEEQYDLLS